MLTAVSGSLNFIRLLRLAVSQRNRKEVLMNYFSHSMAICENHCLYVSCREKSPCVVHKLNVKLKAQELSSLVPLQ